MSEKSVWDKAKDVAADAANMAKDAADQGGCCESLGHDEGGGAH
jgi:hypothetical protein